MILGVLLKQLIGTKSVIKRKSIVFSFWYAFDRLWNIVGFISSEVFGGTIWLPTIYRFFGARIGKKAFFENTFVQIPFKLKCMDRIIIEKDAIIETLRYLPSGDIKIGEVTLESNVLVGSNSFIGHSSRIGQGSVIRPLTRVPAENVVKENIIMEGLCFQKRNNRNEREYSKLHFTHSERFFSIMAPIIIFIPSLVRLVLYVELLKALHGKVWGEITYIILLPFLQPIFVIIMAVFIVYPLRLLLLKFQKASSLQTKVYSCDFQRRWAAKQLFRSAISSTNGSFVALWISNLLGGKIGFSFFPPEIEEPHLTKIGSHSFCANGVQLRNTEFLPGGRAHLAQIEMKDSCMVLDRSVVEAGSTLEENVLVGSLTLISKNIDTFVGQKLFGIPIISLTGHSKMIESSNIKGNEWCFQVIEMIFQCYWNLLYMAIFAAALYFVALFFIYFQQEWSISIALLVLISTLPIVIILLIAMNLLISITVKKVMIGNFSSFLKDGEKLPIYSMKVLRWKLANYFIHSFCQASLEMVNEFWVTRTFWSLMGASIGKNTMIDSNVLLFEADLLKIGENCRIENMATLLNHKFNNGGLEMRRIDVPDNSFVGAKAVILPGSKINGKNVRIMPLTHVMEGEITTNGVWHGSPAEKVNENGLLTDCMM